MVVIKFSRFIVIVPSLWRVLDRTIMTHFMKKWMLSTGIRDLVLAWTSWDTKKLEVAPRLGRYATVSPQMFALRWLGMT